MKYDFRIRTFIFVLGFLLSLFCLPLFVSPVSAAVAVGNTSTSPTSGSPISSTTWSHTVAGTNRFLVVGIGTRDYATVSSVTYGGVALTKSVTISAGTGNYPHSEIWYLLAPTVGTANIVVTLSTADWPTCGAISFTGVNQTTPIRASSTDGIASTISSSGVLVVNPSDVGDLIVDTISYWNSGVYATAGAGQTIYNAAKIDGAWSNSMSVKDGASSATTMTWDIITNTVGWAVTGFALMPAANPLVISATAPANNAYIKTPTVSYTYSSAATSGSIVFTRTGGSADGTTHTCTLIGTALNSGAHTNLTLSNTANICSGWTALVDGAIYTVTYNAADVAGNATPIANTGITYDTTIPTITNTLPATNTAINSAKVNYTLSETASTASITFTRTGGSADGTVHTCTLIGTALSSGLHYSLVLSNTANVCSGWTSLVNGAIYAVAFNATDLAGNAATTVTNTGVDYGVFSGSGLGTSGSPYLITNCTQFQEMRYSTTSYYNLSNDIDCSGVSNVAPISSYSTGAFDGQNHTISNITMNPSGSGNQMGIFLTISACTIKNLIISNIVLNASSFGYVGPLAGAVGASGCTIDNVHINSGTVSGTYYVGGLIGQVDKTANVIINSSSAVNVTGTGNGAGGLVGYNSGSITNSSATGTVTCGALYVGGLVGINYGSISKSFATGTVGGGGAYVGGLVGLDNGYIINTYAMGNVSGTNWVGGCVGRKTSANVGVINSYSKGLITSSGTYVGGFMGLNEGTGAITSCYYDSITSGKSDTGKGTPKTTAEMKLRYTFSGWDFSTIWGINPSYNSGYPQFSTLGGGGSAPTISNVTVNSGSDITLIGGSTKSVTVTGQVSDLDGYANIDTVYAKLYYSAVTNAQNCTLDPTNCYTATCSKSNCSGNSCDVTCNYNLQYYSISSDASSSNPSAYWSAYMTATDLDSLSSSAFSASGSPDVLTLRSLTLDKSSINFGTIYPGSNTGSTNQTILVTNQGNVTFDAELYGTKFCNDYPTCSTSYVSIASTQCKFSTSAFTYSSGGTALPSTATSYQLNNTIYPSNTKTLYLGIAVPYLSSAGLHTGEIFINAISDF